VSVLDLVRRILSHMGSSLEPDVRNDASHEIKHQYLSAAKARRMLDWTPSFELDAGLERTVAWYRDFLSAPHAA
jgi:CDP-glucose 4,6-dehydratase